MPSPRRLVHALSDRRLPLRTRIGLLAADGRRQRLSEELLRVPYGPASVYLSTADYAVDRASFTFAVVEGTYATSYHGAVALDIGAHKGYYAAYAVAHGARAVVTYEPESVNAAILERTAAGYREKGVSWVVHRSAVDVRSGHADLHVMGGSWGHSLAPPASFAEHEVDLERVETVALERVLAESAAFADHARLIVKINIEGAECSAILGTSASAWCVVSEVFVETHPWAECDAAQLAAHLEPAGLTRVESVHPAVLHMRREEPVRSGRRTAPT